MQFGRLSAELEAVKDDTMEGICEALSQELKELQQVYLKKELQKQKQQRQRERSRAGAPKAHQVALYNILSSLENINDGYMGGWVDGQMSR